MTKDVYVKKITRNRKSKMKFSKKLLIWIILFLIVYVVTQEYLFYVHGVEPNPILTGFIFAFCTVEVWKMAGIRIEEIKKGVKDEDRLEDEVDKS